MQLAWLFGLASAVSLVGFSSHGEGNLASRAESLPDMLVDSDTLTFSTSEFRIETGKYYRWRIVHDGGEEHRLLAPELFRNSWIDQVVIENLEVKPMALYSVEFDDAGTIDIWFVPIRPGDFEFWMDGYKTRGLSGKFVVR